MTKSEWNNQAEANAIDRLVKVSQKIGAVSSATTTATNKGINWREA